MMTTFFQAAERARQTQVQMNATEIAYLKRKLAELNAQPETERVRNVRLMVERRLRQYQEAA